MKNKVAKRIYLDYAASTPLDPRVVREMRPFIAGTFGNPASLHTEGQHALSAVDQARAQLGALLKCRPVDVVLTSGATEANALALRGVLKSGDHLVTTTIEHPSVLHVAYELQQAGVEVSIVNPGQDGVVATEGILSAIRPQTRLVSLQYANNELGTIQPVSAIGTALRELNHERKSGGLLPVLYHIDAVQAVTSLSLAVDALGVDVLTLSAHKVYGPKGIGAMYVRPGVAIASLFYHGARESGVRPGTLATPLCVGFGAAVALLAARSQSAEVDRVTRLRDRLEDGIRRLVPGAVGNGTGAARVPGILNMSFPGKDGQSLLIALDHAGVAVSVGSACSAGSPEPSHVLVALGITDSLRRGTVRFSLGRFTKPRDITEALRRLKRCLE